MAKFGFAANLFCTSEYVTNHNLEKKETKTQNDNTKQVIFSFDESTGQFTSEVEVKYIASGAVLSGDGEGVPFGFPVIFGQVEGINLTYEKDEKILILSQLRYPNSWLVSYRCS